MNFYLFNPDFALISEMEDAGFTGNLFTYSTKQADFFTKIARDIDIHQKIKYMVAIRPHTLSPEYLVSIDKSIKEISMKERLQINLISGDIKPQEQNIVRTLGPVTNKSTMIERSKHLIEYVDLLNTLPEKEKPDYYISVTNDFTFDVAARCNAKMIIPYYQYIQGRYDTAGKKVMVSITPIMRRTQEELDSLDEYFVSNKEELSKFTYKQMEDIVDKLNISGIKEVIFSAWNVGDIKKNIEFVKEYNNKEKRN